jgi:hypothetical protein
MPDIVLSLKSDRQAMLGHEKGVQRLLERCPWLRKEYWSVDELIVYALGNEYEFPRYAQDGKGHTIILSGHIRLDDIEERAGDREEFRHFTEDTLLNSLFNLWFKKGRKSLCGLNGRYSLITWDKNEQELNVATDAFGNRHIYYLHANGHISLSTNLSILTCSPHFKKTLDPQGVVESLCLGYQLEERTLFSNIKLVPPSSLLIYKRGKLQIIERKRFACSVLSPDLSWNDATEELHFLLYESLKKRLREQTEYIIPLSGGLDSRCVIGLSDELGLKYRCYTFGVKGCKDLQIAPQVASALGSTTEIALNKPDYILRRWGDPFLLNGDLRIPTIGVFIDFLEYIGRNRGIFISGFMGDTVTGDIYQFDKLNNSLQTPEKFFSHHDLVSLLKIPDCTDLAQEILVTLGKIRNGFTGSDHMKDLMLDLATRQRRYFSFQERLIEYYGGLIVPFEDVKVLEFFLKLPFLAMDNKELYKRFQARYFRSLAKIPSAAYGAMLPTIRSVIVSSLLNDFRYLNSKYFKNIFRIPSFLDGSGSVYAVNHGQSIRHNGAELATMISENRDVLNEFFDLGKIRELFDTQRRGDDSVTRKVLAILLILSGLQACRNGEPLNELSLNHRESLTSASVKDQF